MADLTHADILRDRLEGLIEAVENTVSIPERDCSCHLALPCGDCVKWSMLREAMEEARKALVAAAAGKVPATSAPPPAPPEPPHKCPRCQAHIQLVCGAGAECGNSPRELPAIPVNQDDEE